MAMVLRLHLQLASFTQNDLVEVRLLIERLAARKVADLATEEDTAGLLSLVDQMRGADDTSASAARELADDYSAIVHAIARGDGDRAAELLAGTVRGGRRPTGSSALKWAG
jgi:DNA-binding FadR family transcriptional regulator